MSLHIKTSNPQKMLDDIKEKITVGLIDTWSFDSDGDFTHSPSQWNRKAWLRSYVNEKELIMGIVARKDEKMSKVVYAVYHGRFAEMLLTHFDLMINEIDITSLAQPEYDSID